MAMQPLPRAGALTRIQVLVVPPRQPAGPCCRWNSGRPPWTGAGNSSSPSSTSSVGGGRIRPLPFESHRPAPLSLVPSIAMAVVLYFPVSSESVRSVRIHSTTLVRLLHVLDLLSSGISGKMIISWDTTTIIAMLVVSFLLLSRYLPLVFQAF